MVGDSRQQRRREMREQLKLARSLVETGMPMQPKAVEIVAVAHLLRETLRDTAKPARASETAAIAQKLVERSLAARPTAGRHLACKKGCGYCCHSFVSVTPPEAFRLARAVRDGGAAGMTIDTVRQRARPLLGIAPKARIGARLPCPLLVDGACSVYGERPLVCRQATSLDVSACVSEFEGRDLDQRIPISSAHLEHSSNVHVALLSAMKASGLPTEALELAAALDVALAIPDGETRWLAGEDIFRDVPRQVTREPRIELAVARVAAALQN